MDSPLSRDNRDDSDLRVDALADAICCLLNRQDKKSEALSLLYELEPEVLRRVWSRVQMDDRQSLLAQAQSMISDGRTIPPPLQELLAS